MDGNQENNHENEHDPGIFNFKEIQEHVEQVNKFQRAAKKKSSLKTGKTSAQELHYKIKSGVGLKNIKWKDVDTVKDDNRKPLTNRKFKESETKFKSFVYKILTKKGK